MPRLSVVVPIYNVEEYLVQCLDSLKAQTFEDFEAVLVDDGSTDGSVAVAQRYVDDDPRFRLISQPNGGLSRARNAGTSAASGEFLAFLDSDDALPPNAYELLIGALDRTGSDFATGNVYRLSTFALKQSPFIAKAFTETRLKTHVTKFRPLLADRPAWNKVWRRSFWDRHDFSFPEGRTFEDTPVTISAHFLARSVDVIADPVYYWRIRESGGLSITERRIEQRALIDRLTSIGEVRDHLARHGPRGATRWYEETVVSDDLRYYVEALEAADEDYRAVFLDRVNAFLDAASPRIYDSLPAIERLKWHLVRRRLMPQLLEVLRFEKEDLSSSPPVRVRGKWYGDYPFRTDSQLKIPSSVYRVEREFWAEMSLEQLRADAGRLRVSGYAYIHGIGASTERTQRVDVALLRPGPLQRLRLLVAAVRVRAKVAHRPDVTANTRQSLCDLSWSGFDATIDPRRLRRGERWELYVTVRAAGVKRRRSRFKLDTTRALRPVDIALNERTGLTALVTPESQVAIEVHGGAVDVTGRLLDPETLQLRVQVDGEPGPKSVLELRNSDDGRKQRFPLRVSADTQGGRVAELPLGSLRTGEDVAWELTANDGKRRRLVLREQAAGVWISGEREFALTNLRSGPALVERSPGPVIDEARWADDGVLEIAGRYSPGSDFAELSLVRADSGHSYAFDVERVTDGRFAVRLTPARIRSLAGTLPLSEGRWRLFAPEGAPVRVDEALSLRAPLPMVIDHKPFALGITPDNCAVLAVRRDLDEDERSQYHQRRLRAHVYGPTRSAPLRETAVYTSFHGRQYADSPRAIHEELVRRGVAMEHLWVVRDGRCQVPDTATVLREGSREYYEAMGSARYMIANDHFPDWFERRDGQVCLQTWHGTPLKRLGFDVSDLRKTVRRFQRRWERQVGNWQYVLSPNRFSTPILRRAYAIEGEMVETGYPRVDILARPDRDELSRRLKRRLGIPDGKRVVLYAPTYRDHVVDRRGRYRLELALDLERLRQAVGDDTVLLFRKHHYIYDPVPVNGDGFVRDVSSYPDGTEIMLAADVLITDYSSMMVDFANTGRPMLFFTYDLDAYEEEIRGFYVDFVATVPGPLLHTTDEVVDALRDLDGVEAEYAARYDGFRSTFCELDDGRAAERVVDQLLSW